MHVVDRHLWRVLQTLLLSLAASACILDARPTPKAEAPAETAELEVAITSDGSESTVVYLNATFGDLTQGELLTNGSITWTVSAISESRLATTDVTIATADSLSTTATLPASAAPYDVEFTVEVEYNDETYSASGTIRTAATNASPTLVDIPAVSINEDATGSTVPVLVTDEHLSFLTITATSSNTTLLPNTNLVLTGTGATRSLAYTPALNQYGTTTVTVTVSDGELSVNDTFVVTVLPVNDAPVISNITNRTIAEEGNSGTIAFTISDVETVNTSLTVTATSSNTTLVPNNVINLALSGTDGNRAIIVTPVANGFGSSTISVRVSDGLLTTTDTFVLTVTSVNDLPTISDVSSQTISEDGATGSLGITIGDVETAAAALTLTATSSNPTLVPNSAVNLTFAGSGASRTLVVTPAADAFGSATITLTVTDASGGTATDTFGLTVNSVNDLPTISAIGNASTISPLGLGASFTVADVETSAASLTIAVTSSNETLVPSATNVVVAGSGTNRTVTVTPDSGQSGFSDITLTVSDADGGDSPETFRFTVAAAGTVVADNFDRADATNLGNTSTGGLSWSELVADPNFEFGVVSNSFSANLDLPSMDSVEEGATIDAATAEGTLRIKLGAYAATGSGAVTARLVFRFVDSANYLYVEVPPSGAMTLGKRVAGVDSSLGSLGVAASAGDVLEASFAGSSLTAAVYASSTLVPKGSTSATESDHQSATAVGIFGLGSASAAATASRALDDLQFSAP